MVGAVVIGSSAGGINVLIPILRVLPPDYAIPLIVIQHRANEQTELLEELLQYKCRIKIKQADEKEKIAPRSVYFAPPGYHLLVEADKTFSLASDELVKYSMPSIDVTFETAAEVFKDELVGIIMTGASSDGAEGIRTIKRFNGVTIAQDPEEAQNPFMPRAAIQTKCIDFIMKVNGIQAFLKELPTFNHYEGR
jgi:two-component system, chemotaxis family, protein-glutamate methylesterase/glutaminase